MSLVLVVVLALCAVLWFAAPQTRPIVAVVAGILVAWWLIGYVQAHP